MTEMFVVEPWCPLILFKNGWNLPKIVSTFPKLRSPGPPRASYGCYIFCIFLQFQGKNQMGRPRFSENSGNFSQEKVVNIIKGNQELGLFLVVSIWTIAPIKFFTFSLFLIRVNTADHVIHIIMGHNMCWWNMHSIVHDPSTPGYQKLMHLLGTRNLLDTPVNGCCWLVNTVWYCMWGPNLHWPDHPTWTKMDIDQSTMGIGGRVSDFLVPNRCINLW